MLRKVLLGLAFLILLFAGYVQSRPNHFRYERSGVINAAPDKIYPYLSDFRRGEAWSPYEKKDLSMKKTFSGPATGVGSIMDFEGNSEVGTGRLEILKSVPNSLVEVRLEMLKPFKGTNLIEYKLTPEANGTRFTWVMSGEGNFIMKAVGVFIDCEKMVADDFSKGIENLKVVIESKK